MTSLRIVVVLLLAGLTVAAQQPSRLEWHFTGPADGDVTDIVETSRGRLFAATTKGLYQSNDDGVHWTRCSEASGSFVRMLRDGQLLIGPTPGRALSYVDATCAVRETVTLPSGFSGQPVIGALVRLKTGRVLASRWTVGLFASDDAGRQWHQVALPPLPGGDWIFSFASMPSDHVVAASNGSILRSSDGGDTWIRTGVGKTMQRLVVGSSGTLFGAGDGVSRSLDEGETWQSVALAGQSVQAVMAIGTGMPGANPGMLLAAVPRPDRFSNTVLRSTDGGATWTPTGSELTGRVNVFAHTLKGSLIAGTTSGFYRSRDRGAHWQFHGVAPAALNTIAASQDGLVVAGIPRGWMSSDDGRTWSSTPMGFNALNGAHEAPGVYGRALFIGRSGRLYTVGQYGVSFSTDRAQTWTRAGLTRDTFALAELSDGTLLAATYNNGIFRSQDRGETWVERSVGLTEFTAIGLSTLISGSVVAATLHQTFLSTDAGDTWEPLTRGFPRQALRPVLPQGTAHVAVVGVGTTLYELDATNSWRVAIDTRSPITTLTWDDARRLWIGTKNDGVALARTDRSQWSVSYVGPSSDAVHSVAIARDQFFASTAGGLFRAALPAVGHGSRIMAPWALGSGRSVQKSTDSNTDTLLGWAFESCHQRSRRPSVNLAN